MAEKDITEKLLEDYNDVFADIVNVLLFDGKRVIGENELTNAKDKSQYKIANVIHEQEWDVAKFWSKGKVRIALCGLENQTTVDKDMPLRIISYDGAAYRAQIAEAENAKREATRDNNIKSSGSNGQDPDNPDDPKRKETADISGKMNTGETDTQQSISEEPIPKEIKTDEVTDKISFPRYPVVTLVLYFGLTRWSGSSSLLECLEIPEEIKPYVSDYKINIFEIAFLEDEQINKFQSDFRIVADYFVQKRKNKDYKPSREIIRHVDEVLKLMSVLTQDNSFAVVQNEVKGEASNMEGIFDKVERLGIEKGITQGKVQGKILAYADMGLSKDKIAEKVGITEDEVNKILEEQEA